MHSRSVWVHLLWIHRSNEVNAVRNLIRSLLLFEYEAKLETWHHSGMSTLEQGDYVEVQWNEEESYNGTVCRVISERGVCTQAEVAFEDGDRCRVNACDVRIISRNSEGDLGEADASYFSSAAGRANSPPLDIFGTPEDGPFPFGYMSKDLEDYAVNLMNEDGLDAAAASEAAYKWSQGQQQTTEEQDGRVSRGAPSHSSGLVHAGSSSNQRAISSDSSATASGVASNPPAMVIHGREKSVIDQIGQVILNAAFTPNE